MSLKKTLIIAVIFAAILGIYYFDQGRIKKETAREEQESRLVAPVQKDLTNITLNNAGESIKLEKQDETWKLTAPIEARSDKSIVDSMLGELDRARKEDPFDVPADKLADYGLKEPKLVAEVQSTSNNYVEKLQVGNETTDGGEVYIKIGDGEKVYTVPSSVKTQLNKTVNDLRDKRTLPANLNQATSLTLAFSGLTYQLESRDGKWNLISPEKGRADGDKVTEILREWNTARASDFIDTATLDLAQFGFNSPEWTGKVYVAGEDPRTSITERTLLIGANLPNDNSKRYAMEQGGKTVFAVSDTMLNKVKPTLDDLRSKQIFTVASDDIGRVVLNTRGNVMTLVRDSAGLWRFADDQATKLDQAVVSTKLNDLIALKATRYVATAPETAKSGLDDPNLRVTVSNKAGTTTETLATGRKDDAEDIVYAEMGDATSSATQYIAIDWQQPGKFFVTREDFIDKSLFDFGEDLVTKVEITDSSKSLTLAKSSSGAWTGKGGTKEASVEATRMTQLMYSITSLAWSRKLNKASETDIALVKTQQLENPPRQLTLYDDVGNVVAKLGLGGEEERYAYVRKGADEYFAIDKSRLITLTDSIKKLVETVSE